MKKITGFTAGTFDFVHAGHLLMFEECKKYCDYLIVAIQPDPNVDQPNKNRPIESMEERLIRLKACKYVDEVMIYHTQQDLYNLVDKLIKEKKINVRFVGDDHKGKAFTGDSLHVKIIYNSRSHNYSSTNLRIRTENGKRN